MKKYICLSMLLLSLSACGPMPDPDQQEIQECARLGFQPMTDAFSNCRLQLRAIGAQQQTADAIRDQSDTIEDASQPKDCKKTHHGWTICK